jgi:magnesium transporter
MAMSRTKPRRSRSEHAEHAKLIGADLLEEAHRASDWPTAVLRVATLVGDTVEESEGVDALTKALARPDATTWIDLTGATAEEVAAITKVVGLHPLIAEDILEGNQRAKIEVTDELIHIVLFAFEYTDHAERAEIDIVLGKGFLLTVHGPEWDPRTVPALRGGLAPVLARGPDHLLWALVDAVVDGYFPLLDLLGDAIEDVQEHVIANARPETLEKLFALKTELLVIRRAAAPIREIFNQLTNRDLALIDDDEVLYFRDVYDHLIRLTDELDNYRELVSGTLDVYLSTVNNQLSLIMKRLTGVTVVLTGIAAIAGIFGMSEAGTALGGMEAGGFWLVTGLTIGLAFLMAWVLRKIDWI